MPQRTVVVASRVGLHARPAMLFTQAVAETGLPVTIARPGGEPVDAGSILFVMSLGVPSGEEVTLDRRGRGCRRGARRRWSTCWPPTWTPRRRRELTASEPGQRAAGRRRRPSRRRRTGGPGATRTARRRGRAAAGRRGHRPTSRPRTPSSSRRSPTSPPALREQSARSTGTVKDVLAATAQMADDKALRTQVLARIDAGRARGQRDRRRRRRCSRRCSSRPAATSRSGSPTCAPSGTASSRGLGLPAPGVPALDRPSVIVASDLAPADTAALDLANVVAIVTELGGPTSHTAIIAAQLDLPCLVRVDRRTRARRRTHIAIDAATGTVTLDPDEAMRAAIVAAGEGAGRAQDATRRPGATQDGHAVQLLANIGTVEDAERAAEEDVEGVGLFRTEVLFLDSRHRPDRRGAGQGLHARCSPPSATARSSSARSTPAPTSRWPSRPSRRRGEPGARRARATGWSGRTPQLLDDQLTAIAQAAQGHRRNGRG